MASMQRRIRRRNRVALTPGRRPGQPRAADDPPTPQQVRYKNRWDAYVDSEGLDARPRAPLFETMDDLSGAQLTNLGELTSCAIAPILATGGERP